MSIGYTKLFSSIVTSTIWVESDRTRIVWITMLALADRNGEIQASIPGLARLAGVPIPDCEEAIAKFTAPDQYSRTPDDQGRRIEKIEGGWALLNHAKYREMASRDDSKAANAERQQRHREKAKRNAAVTHSNAEVTHTLHIAEAEAEAEAEAVKLNNTAPVPVAGDELALDCPFSSQEKPGAKPKLEKKPKQAKRAPADRNDLLDALVRACGSDPLQIVPSAWSGHAKALSEINAVSPNLAEAELKRRAQNYETHFAKPPPTPFALAKHWALCDKPNANAPKPADKSEYNSDNAF